MPMRFRKNRDGATPEMELLSNDPTERARAEKRRYIKIVLINTILIYGLYVILINLLPFAYPIIFIVYFSALAISSFGYVFYNRGFTRKNLTVEMLPMSWSEQEKTEYIEDGKRRAQKSRWCLAIIFPLIFTFFIEMFYLFIYQEHFAPILEGLF